MRLSLLGVAALALSSLAAHADTVTIFALTDVTLQAGSATGYVTIDVTTGTAINANISVVDNGTTYLFLGVPSFSTSTPHDSYFNIEDPQRDSLQLSVPVLTFQGYTGSVLCSLAQPCVDPTSGYPYSGGLLTSPNTVNAITGGSLMPTVPEPSTLALLGTGLVGAVGTIRRRV